MLKVAVIVVVAVAVVESWCRYGYIYDPSALIELSATSATKKLLEL